MPKWEFEVSQEEYDARVLAKEIAEMELKLHVLYDRRVKLIKALQRQGWSQTKLANVFDTYQQNINRWLSK